MTFEEYEQEHGSDMDFGEDPVYVGRCDHCDEDVLEYQEYYKHEDGTVVHAECIDDYLSGVYTVEDFAEKCGFERHN